MVEGVAAAAPVGPGLTVARRIRGATGWRRLVLAVGFGVLAAGAMPPIYAFVLLWPAFTGLIWLLDGARRPLVAFALGWAFGAGYFMAGLYWVGIAFLVDAEQFAALMPVAIAALAIGLGLFPGLAALAAWLWGARGIARAFAFTLAWLVLVEWLRSWVLTGFPWNFLGTTWAFSPAMSQLAAVTGVWGMTAVTLLAACLPATLADGESPKARWLPGVAGLLALALVWAGGMVRLATAPPVAEDAVPGVMLRLVQPSIEQSLKWRHDLRRRHVFDQMALSRAAGAERVTHVIWAETAVPFNLSQEAELRENLRSIVPKGGLLLTGAPRITDEGGRRRIWNSFHALDGEGEIRATYDKAHLVPFGEYVPLKGVLGLSKLTAGRLDFSPGTGPRNLDLPGLPPAAPLICYEVIFPGSVVPPGPRPAWLLNVTNDAWFGTSSGPYQHLASARLRAIEEGLPLVRAANNGLSAVVDSYGRLRAGLGLNQVGVVDSVLPLPARRPPAFAYVGNWVILGLALLLGVPAMLGKRRRGAL